MSSFDPPNVEGAISPFRSVNFDTHAEYAADIIGVWLLEQLSLGYPSHKGKGGELIPINYSWFFSLKPKADQVMALPAVAIDVVVAENATIGSAIGAGQGAVAAGALRDAEIAIVIIANSSRLASSIEGRLSRVLDRIVNFAIDNPLTHLTKFHFADDRGFSSIDRFVMTSLWQNLSDEAFVKITFYNSAFVEDYIDDDDELWAGIVGGIGYVAATQGSTSGGSTASHISLAFKFTPTIP